MATLNLDLYTLRLFVAVCETENFAHAAERLHVVGSAVSKRMVALERELGTRLFERRRHGVETTAAGETFLEYARTILSNVQKAEQAMAGYASGISGHVRLLTNPSVMSGSLVEDIVEFMRNPMHSGIKVDVEARYGPDVVRGVRDGHASPGVTWDAANLLGLESTPYRMDHLGVAVPAGHPLAGRDAVEFEQTLEWEHVKMPSNSAVQALLERAAAQAGKPFLSRVMVANFDAGLPMARAGLAICTAPMELLPRAAERNGLSFVRYSNPWATRRFVLCYPNRSALNPAAQMLVAHLENLASNNQETPEALR